MGEMLFMFIIITVIAAMVAGCLWLWGMLFWFIWTRAISGYNYLVLFNKRRIKRNKDRREIALDVIRSRERERKGMGL